MVEKPPRLCAVGGAFCAVMALAFAAATLMVLAGCGVIGEKTVYLEWYSTYFEKYYVRWMEDFEKAHADQNVVIRFRAMPSNAGQKVYTMLISHTLSDVIQVTSGTSTLLLSEPVLEPVSPADIDEDDFMELALRMASTNDGTLVGYPTGASMRGFVYFNRDCFEEAGTSEAETPETFDEYRAWASRLSRWRSGDDTIVGIPGEDALAEASLLRRPIGMTRGFVWSCISFILAYMDPLPDADGKSDGSIDDYLGGPPSRRPFRFDTPEFAEGLREYRDFFLPKKTAIADGDMSRMNGFKRGVYSGMEGGNWIYGEISTIDLQVTKFPRAEGRPMRTWMASSSVGVSRESRHKELAVEFAKFLSSSEAQVDAYYGHGYLPCRFSAWDRLAADAEEDVQVRARFLEGFTGSADDYVGLPQVKRRYHDVMDIILYAPLAADRTIVSAGDASGYDPVADATVSVAKPEEGDASSTDTSELAGRYRPDAVALQKKISDFTGQKVTVIVRGTPPEMVPSRSFVIASPISVYSPLLRGAGVWFPADRQWDRIASEVITRVLQFVTRDTDPMPVEEAAKWAQEEAKAILAGRK